MKKNNCFGLLEKLKVFYTFANSFFDINKKIHINYELYIR